MLCCCFNLSFLIFDFVQFINSKFQLYFSSLRHVETVHSEEDNSKYKMDNTSNLHGLLNLVRQINLYGPLRMYWDGSYKCEGVLRSAKPLVNHGTHVKHFSKHALARHYKEKFISNQLGPDLMRDTQGDGNQTHNRFCSFKTHPTFSEAKSLMHAGNPLSIVVFQDDTMGLSCFHDNEHVVAEIFPDDKSGHEHYATWISTIKIFDEDSQFKKLKKEELLDMTVVKHCALSLPANLENARGHHHHCIITHDWMERRKIGNDFVFVLPRVVSTIY